MARTGLTDAEVAAGLRVNAEIVRLWRHERRRIPAERAVEISKIFGFPRFELRPDLWEPPRVEDRTASDPIDDRSAA
jgi:DNA-binding transcriptional regulator YdaS (Cro superfamily)